MIELRKTGSYTLSETKHHIKILYMDNQTFAWIESPSFGEILVTSHGLHKPDYLLSIGRYHIYDVKDEPHLSDQTHLELEAGQKAWQGYLLLTGLPDDIKKRARIIPTHEIITNNPHYQKINL